MIREKRNLYISEVDKNELLNIIRYEKSDLNVLRDFYITFMKSNEAIKKLGGKRLFLPPEFVETVVAYKMDYWRIDDMQHKFDCYDPNSINRHNRIEVKFSVGRIDTVSFSQEMTWDRLNFVKIYMESATTCFFEIYDIDKDTITDIINPLINENCGPDYRFRSRLRINILQQFIEKGIYNNKIDFSLF